MLRGGDAARPTAHKTVFDASTDSRGEPFHGRGARVDLSGLEPRDRWLGRAHSRGDGFLQQPERLAAAHEPAQQLPPIESGVNQTREVGILPRSRGAELVEEIGATAGGVRHMGDDTSFDMADRAVAFRPSRSFGARGTDGACSPSSR